LKAVSIDVYWFNAIFPAEQRNDIEQPVEIEPTSVPARGRPAFRGKPSVDLHRGIVEIHN
jgi:hypothetical protein